MYERKGSLLTIKNECKDRIDKMIDFDLALVHKNKHSHSVFMNVFTNEIICSDCGIEILDEKLIKNEREFTICDFKRKFKEDLIEGFKGKVPGNGFNFGNKFKKTGLVLIKPRTLTNSFATLAYILWGVPFFQFMLKRIYMIELENIERFSRVLTSKDIFLFCRIIFHLDQLETFDDEMFTRAWISFVSNNPMYMTHTFVDVNELLSDTLSLFHLTLTHYSKPPEHLSNLGSGMVDYIEEADDEDQVGMQQRNPRVLTKAKSISLDNEIKSPIFASLGGEIQKSYVCESCGYERITLEHFISLNFKILGEDVLKDVRQRFKDGGYDEGLRVKTVVKKKGIFGLFRKYQEEKIVATLRDYLCHLNLLQKEQLLDKCENCCQETRQTASMMLNKAPPIFVIGFIPNDAPEEKVEYDIDFEIDISPFLTEEYPEYELQCAVTFEEQFMGIKSYTVFIKNSKKKWLKVTQFGIKQIKRDEIKRISMPSLLIYQKKIMPDPERENLYSNFKTRSTLGLNPRDLIPIPNYFMEQSFLLGETTSLHLSKLLCPHKGLPPSYFDIYENKILEKITFPGEEDVLDKKSAVKLEREFCSHKEVTFQKIMLTSTLMPEPIADHVFEKEEIPNVIRQYKRAIRNKICAICLKKFNLYKLRRLVEQYLFLKYEKMKTYPEDKNRIDLVWARQWHYYLFYDSKLYLEFELTKNYPLIPKPQLYRQKDPINENFIEVNKYLAFLIQKLYKKNFTMDHKDFEQNYSRFDKNDIDLINKLVQTQRSVDKGLLVAQATPAHSKKNLKAKKKCLFKMGSITSTASIEESTEDIISPIIEKFEQHHKICKKMLGLSDKDISVLKRLIRKGIESFELRMDLDGENCNIWVYDVDDEDKEKKKKKGEESDSDTELSPEDLIPIDNRNEVDIEKLKMLSEQRKNPSLSKIEEIEEEYGDSTFRLKPEKVEITEASEIVQKRPKIPIIKELRNMPKTPNKRLNPGDSISNAYSPQSVINFQNNQSYCQTFEDAVQGFKQKTKRALEDGKKKKKKLTRLEKDTPRTDIDMEHYSLGVNGKRFGSDQEDEEEEEDSRFYNKYMDMDGYDGPIPHDNLA